MWVLPEGAIEKMKGRKRCQPFPNINRYTFSWELPGDLVAWLQSLVGELRSYKPHDMAKGKRRIHTHTHIHTHTSRLASTVPCMVCWNWLILACESKLLNFQELLKSSC